MNTRMIVLLGSLALAACAPATSPPSAPEPTPAPTPPTVAPALADSSAIQRPIDEAQVARGAAIYQQNCAVCHGERAEGIAFQAGSPLWGPALDDSEHAWHHPRHVLHDRIKQGSRGMPAFGDRLTDRQIDDVIAWFQSLWSDETYEAWSRMNRRRAG